MNYRNLISDSFLWGIGYVGVQLFLGSIRSRMTKESISRMANITTRASFSLKLEEGLDSKKFFKPGKFL